MGNHNNVLRQAQDERPTFGGAQGKSAQDQAVQRFAVYFGRAFGLTFAAIMAFVLLVAGGLALLVSASVSVGAGALRAAEVGFVVGIGYAALSMMREGQRASGVRSQASGESEAAAADAPETPPASGEGPSELKVA